MPTLENNRLVFRFPRIGEDATFSFDFQRTLRIPDTEKTYFLPPGLGAFPLRHAEDFPGLSAATTVARRGDPADVAGGGHVAELRPVAVPRRGSSSRWRSRWRRARSTR